jgi:glycosyltransferase involved in cell wall biosynthesis
MSFTKGKISVVSISYRHKEFLLDWQKGILAQDYFPLQVICIDDCSDDGSSEYLLNLKWPWPRSFSIDVRVNGTNVGGPANLTKALSLVDEDSEYISILETDDYYKPDKLKRSIEFMESKGYDAVCGEISAIIHPHNHWIERGWNNIGIHPPEHLTFEYLLWDNRVYTCTFICKSKILKECYSPLEFQKMGYGVLGDYPMFLWIAKRYKIGYMQEALSVYRESRRRSK